MQDVELLMLNQPGTGRMESQAETCRHTEGHEDDEDGEEDATEQLLGVVWVHQRKKGEGCLSAATIIASPCRDCLHPSTQAEPKTDLF